LKADLEIVLVGGSPIPFEVAEIIQQALTSKELNVSVEVPPDNPEWQEGWDGLLVNETVDIHQGKEINALV